MRSATGARAAPAETESAGEAGWFVYAVVDAGSALPGGLAGLDEESLDLVEVGPVAAVVSRFALDRAAVPARDLLRFQQVVDALAGEVDAVLPVRFGSVLVDREELESGFLASSQDWLVEMLDGVRGCVQFTVQALYRDDALLREIVASDPEVAALREHTRGLPEDVGHGERVRLGELVAAASDELRARDADALLREIVPLTRAHALRPVSGLERALDVAVLVDRHQRLQLDERLEVLAEEVHERMAVRLLGPTAAYDFGGGA